MLRMLPFSSATEMPSASSALAASPLGAASRWSIERSVVPA